MVAAQTLFMSIIAAVKKCNLTFGNQSNKLQTKSVTETSETTYILGTFRSTFRANV